VNDHFTEFVTLVLYSLPGLLAGFTLHELAHAAVAVRCGDPTPRRDGRITLDPRQHIDPIGLGALLVVGFGWAKPVAFNPYYVRSSMQRALVAAAGPLTNLALAGICAAGLRLLVDARPGVANPLFDNDAFGHGGSAAIAFFVLFQAFYVNVILFVFNMLPIPSLDGFAVLKGALGRVIPDVIDLMERNRQLIFIAAIVLIFVLPRTSSGGSPLGSLINAVADPFYDGVVPPHNGLRSLLTSLS